MIWSDSILSCSINEQFHHMAAQLDWWLSFILMLTDISSKSFCFSSPHSKLISFCTLPSQLHTWIRFWVYSDWKDYLKAAFLHGNPLKWKHLALVSQNKQPVLILWQVAHLSPPVLFNRVSWITWKMSLHTLVCRYHLIPKLVFCIIKCCPCH